MRVPRLVQKWPLFFDSWDLRAGSCAAVVSELFAVSTLSNLQRCLIGLNGSVTIVIDGSERAAETCCRALEDRE
jgi:hypothetical protein